MSTTPLGPGQIVAGRYRIEQLLGAGGMGSVYRAVDLPAERTVALKLIVDEHPVSPALIERFVREASALGRLVHPNTVRLLDSGRSERGDPFLVMELLEGSDLAEDLSRHGPMRWDHALAVSRQVLSSLGEAHEAGIVHRDIKPANVFLCNGPSWPLVKVLDFGIARAAEAGARTRRLTLTGTVIGSAAYMSPEQAQGKAVGPATDLYALGAVLFEMLTGKPPFDGLVFTAQLLAKVMQPAPGLRAASPALEVPSALHALVAELLEREPARRPASARELIERIDALHGAAAALPPLSRSALAPPAAAPAAPKTELMLPPTVDESWLQQRTGTEVQRERPRGALRWALAAPVPLAALLVWWVLRPPGPLQLEQPVLALTPEVSAGERAPGEPARTELAAEGAEQPSAAEPPSGPGEGPAAPEAAARAPQAPGEASQPPRGSGDPRRGLWEPGAVPREAVPREAVPREVAPRAPSAAAPPSEPHAGASRPSTVAEAVRAERAGEIAPLQRNDIIAALRRQRYEARARAAADFRAGRISRRELRERQRAIDRRYEGR